jgi:hypothetical protein
MRASAKNSGSYRTDYGYVNAQFGYWESDDLKRSCEFSLEKTLISTGIFNLKAAKRPASRDFTPSSGTAFAKDLIYVIRQKNKVGQVAQLPDIGDKFDVRVR